MCRGPNSGVRGGHPAERYGMVATLHVMADYGRLFFRVTEEGLNRLPHEFVGGAKGAPNPARFIRRGRNAEPKEGGVYGLVDRDGSRGPATTGLG